MTSPSEQSSEGRSAGQSKSEVEVYSLLDGKLHPPLPCRALVRASDFVAHALESTDRNWPATNCSQRVIGVEAIPPDIFVSDAQGYVLSNILTHLLENALGHPDNGNAPVLIEVEEICSIVRLSVGNTEVLDFSELNCRLIEAIAAGSIWYSSLDLPDGHHFEYRDELRLREVQRLVLTGWELVQDSEHFEQRLADHGLSQAEILCIQYFSAGTKLRPSLQQRRPGGCGQALNVVRQCLSSIGASLECFVDRSAGAEFPTKMMVSVQPPEGSRPDRGGV